MKRLKYLTRGGSFMIAGLFILASCSEDVMDRVNKDLNHTDKVPSKYIITDVITSTAFNNVGGDVSTYTSTYVEHEVGTHNQLFRAEHRQGEPSAASTFNNVWNNLYATLKNARVVITNCSQGGPQEGNAVTKGVAEVLAAYNSALLADLFGDTPWSQAAQFATTGVPEHMNPKIDKQKDIYAGIFKYLDDAIADLKGTDAHATGALGANDLLFKGNKELWSKLAYGLKARYTMRLIKTSTNLNADLEKVIEFVDKSFANAKEQAAFNIYSASNYNPLFDFQWSRDGLAASESMSEKLIERNDPRLRRVFVSADWVQMEDQNDADFFMAPNGKNEELQYYYNTSIFVFSQLASTMLLSYHELQFLKAEALVRLGREAEAEPVLKSAVIAAIANTEASVKAAMSAPDVLANGGLAETTDAITPGDASDYFDTDVKPLFDANPLKEVMNQKYLAFFGASGEATECYSDIRRLKALGENLITLKNPGKFPLRCPYGNDDTTTNPEIKAAFGDGTYVYSAPVWWAGGTR